jgi:beta-lactam-binding protein with PASTA domain
VPACLLPARGRVELVPMRYRPSSVRAVGVVIPLVPLLLSGCLGGGSAQSSPPPTATRKVVVPNVEPVYVQDAESSIKAAGLRFVILSVPRISDADASVNGYAIAGQTPAAGLRVPLGTRVVLRLAVSVNAGPGGVGRPGVVPELVGMSVNRAISVATSVGLHVTVPAVQHGVPSDAVTSQSLAPGSPVCPDAVITLTLG